MSDAEHMAMRDSVRRFSWARNPCATPDATYGPAQSRILNAQGFERARDVITAWPGYAPTPLVNLSGIARLAGVAAVHYKDESQRFGLSSFKPLGGAYAVARRLMREIARITGVEAISVEDLLRGRYREVSSSITVTAATDGNHGRSVAWGARLFGCRAVIFIHETVTDGREQAIAALRAEVRRTPGSYDDAVRTARATAEAEGWAVIPDTSDGYSVEAPRDVMQGYALMAAEAIEQLGDHQVPSHMFLQAGVGGMAAAACAQFWQIYQGARPRTILVEPASSGCWFESLQAGHPVSIEGAQDSIMAGLACGEVSRLAWDILHPGADAMMTVSDDAAADCMRLLADRCGGDPPVVAGESAVAGLAGLLGATGDAGARVGLGLGPGSRVMLFGTEGATDPDTYAGIVGRSAEAVAAQ